MPGSKPAIDRILPTQLIDPHGGHVSAVELLDQDHHIRGHQPRPIASLWPTKDPHTEIQNACDE